MEGVNSNMPSLMWMIDTLYVTWDVRLDLEHVVDCGMKFTKWKINWLEKDTNTKGNLVTSFFQRCSVPCFQFDSVLRMECQL